MYSLREQSMYIAADCCSQTDTMPVTLASDTHRLSTQYIYKRLNFTEKTVKPFLYCSFVY